jgi:hypothetical protein
MESTADDSVKITSSVSGFVGLRAVKRASKASGLDGGGTVVETEMGRWMEKNDATWTSGDCSGQSYDS